MSMDVQSSGATAPVESSTPVQQAPAQTSAAPQTTDQGGAPSPTGETPAQPAWQPSFKFKVMDKEHEIDEFVRGAIKDQETEKKIKELYEKAYGLDVVKPRFNEVREKYKTLNETHTSVMKGIQELREHFSRGDLDSFFHKLNIPQEKILQWVLDKAQYNELPPEQRQVLDAKRAAEQRAYLLEKQVADSNQQYEQALVQAKNNAFEVALRQPDITDFATKFDSAGIKNAKGETLSFRDACIEIGEYAWYASQGKVDLTPQQAIQEVMSRYGYITQIQTQPKQGFIPAQGTQGQAQQAPNGTAPKAQPTLPNVAGRQTSSISKAKPKSLEDLKKLATQMSR